MKALITGSEGFVGKYLRSELKGNGYDTAGVSRRVVDAPECFCADIMEPNKIRGIIAGYLPDVIFHLAGQADVGLSWKDPVGTMEANIVGALRLLEAVRDVDRKIRVIIIGSSDEYGRLGNAGRLISEATALNPMTPYAVSKAAQEKLAMAYVQAYGMDICMTRSFNHCGAGQKRGFIVSDFASGIVEIERGKSDRLLVGNLDSARDYTHVKDIVRAYRLIAEKGVSGTVYNVGTGISHSGGELLERLVSMAEAPIRVEQDPNRLRPSDTPVVCCDNSLLVRTTGWKPTISFDDMLLDVLNYWRRMTD